MTAAVIVGWVAAVISLIGSLPQLLKIFSAKSAAGVSLLMWQLMFGNFIGWTVHGFRVSSPNLWVTNGLMGVVALGILLLILRERRLGVWQIFWVPIAITVGLVGAELFFGSIGFAAVVIFPQGFGVVAQIVSLLREVDVSGVSGMYLLLAVIVQVAWFTWGILDGDPAVRVASTVQGLLCLTCYLLYLGRIKNIVQPRLAKDGKRPSKEIIQPHEAPQPGETL